MIEFILGFCFAVSIIAILGKQKSIKDLEKHQRDSVDSLQRLEEMNLDKISELAQIKHSLNDIVVELESIRNKRG